MEKQAFTSPPLKQQAVLALSLSSIRRLPNSSVQLIEVMDALYPDDLVMNGYHGFLFRNRYGYFLSAHNINRAIERISIAYNAEEMDQAELEDREPELLPHFSVHNLRHTFCTTTL